MPIYEYYCNSCQKRFDKMRPMSKADELCACPQCGLLAGRKASTFAARGDGGHSLAGGGGGCSSCAGGSCGTCGH